jgi:alpha-L-fucosidase 2
MILLRPLPGKLVLSILFITCLIAPTVNCLGNIKPKKTHLSGAELAQQHSINYNKPAPTFFEGALLGNGGMGVVVTTRPDAVVMHFGHNNVWDIRIAENHKSEIGTFKEIFEKVQKIPATLNNLTEDAWYQSYNRMVSDNYNKPYPRPFPCGTVLLGFDRRQVELIGHRLDISDGLCTIKLLICSFFLIYKTTGC